VSSARSSDSPQADPFARAVRDAVVLLVDAVRAVQATNPVVLIDGRSGAGKSTLARALVRAWPMSGRVQLVALDSLYPGWDGLAEGARIATEAVLVPHARGLIGVWQRWDWAVQAPAEAHAVDPALPLIVEGCGILDARTARLGDVRVWLDSPPSSRRRRALERDGDTYRPHWERWAAQEDAQLAEHRPAAHATHAFTFP